MQRSTGWYQVVAISLLLHGLLLSGIGFMSGNYKEMVPETEYTEMELISDPDALKEETLAIDNRSANIETPMMQEVIGDERTHELEKKVLDSEKEKRGDTQAKNVRKMEPVTKDVPAQMLFHYNKNQLDLALLQYSQALAMNSQTASIYSNRGQIYYDKGELEKAFSDFNQALKINPQLASAYIGRGYIYIRRGEWDLAFDDFNQGIIISPQNALAYYGRAVCFSVHGEKQKATRDFQLFIQYASPEYDHFIQSAQKSISKLGE